MNRPVGPAVDTTPRPLPARVKLQGRYVVLEPLHVRHAEDLWRAAQGADESWTYLGYGPFASADVLARHVAEFAAQHDPTAWAVRPIASGQVSGWLTLMDIQPKHAAIELGHIWLAPAMQRTAAATEAMFLLLRLAADDPRLPAAGVEVRRAERAVPPRRGTAGLHLRGHPPGASDGEGSPARHRLVQHPGRGMAVAARCHPGLAGAGEFRRRGDAAPRPGGDPHRRLRAGLASLLRQRAGLSGLEDLIGGYRRFRAERWPERRAAAEALAELGQAPKAVVVACADSRADPAVIFDAAPGELFVIRNVAALVPPYAPDSAYHGTSAALEFGVRVLRIPLIIVMGHAMCGGIGALLRGAPEEAGDFVANWMSIGNAAREAALVASPVLQQREAEYEVVRLSLANLLTFPWIAERVNSGSLALKGAHYGIRSGVLALLASDGVFRPV